MASHTNTGPARSELTTVITIDDALILFQPGAQQASPGPTPGPGSVTTAPFSGAQFKTRKYLYDCPRFFATVQDARMFL